ncbi:helix-turn-helix domain-containing protein [Flagellimonas oceanensis]|uniref:helix-turn-helix domain-containing protein n=1 Tax=Flagellimonas oceanensis TaxID=2499163 RepID=UPI000F8EBD8C|nr:AraC family transcriptional regulator [Allomuricauda oceanensis]
MSVKLEICDTDIKQIIEDLSDNFKVDVEEDNNEFCVRIPKKIGSGFIKGTHFEHGVGVLEFDCQLNEELILEHQKGLVHPLKLIFNRESTIYQQFDETDELNEINKLESAILSSTPQNNHIFTLPADQPLCIYSLEINRKLFEDKISEFLGEMNEDLMTLFRDVNGTQLFFHKGHYSLEIAKFLEEFTECDLTHFMKTVYQEGKAYEILSHQLQQYLDDMNGEGGQKILRQATLSKIEKAAEIIQDELNRLDNIVSLAKRVELNQNTLQQGFKKLYKVSVNEYIRNYRIEKAKELLENTDMNISEISYKIGINSRSYLSKLFKEKYGVSPKEYHNQLKKRDR